LLVLWTSDSLYYPTFYIEKTGDTSPFWYAKPISRVIAAAISEHWLIYTELDLERRQIRINVHYVDAILLDNNDTAPAGVLKSDIIHSETMGLGFSLAINDDTLMAGYPTYVSNTWGLDSGAIFVWVYDAVFGGWYLVQIIESPESGYKQSFARSIALRGKTAIIHKARDNTVEPGSSALFVYSQLPDGTFTPKAKIVSSDWDSQKKKDSGFLLSQLISIKKLLYFMQLAVMAL